MKIFISGASGGLGAHVAKEFIVLGDEVWGIGRRRYEMADIEESLRKNFKYSQCDTTVYEEVKSTFEEMAASAFIPDIIIFCAGGATDDIIEGDFSLDKFRENFDINLYGILRWVELLLPYFLKRNRGVFAGISSMSVFIENHAKRTGYSASKLALNKTFENLRLEYLDTGVRFVIFNMGRMKEKKDLIGTSYSKAAALIVKILKENSRSNVFNIPFTQYLLTKIVQFVPKWMFGKYIRG